MGDPGEREAEEARRAFVRRTTRLRRPEALPELALHLVDEVTPLWEMTEVELAQEGVPPPFWAVAWAGGAGLARYLLESPAVVRGRTVLDVATGSGVVALAAARCGAARVTAADVDPFCGAAVALNAEANGLAVSFVARDLLAADPPGVDVLTAGDVCYDRAMTARFLPWLRTAAANGTLVLLGDPGRAFLPKDGLRPLASYDVETSVDVESTPVRRTTVYALDPP